MKMDPYLQHEFTMKMMEDEKRGGPPGGCLSCIALMLVSVAVIVGFLL